jgi:hypothetical protein
MIFDRGGVVSFFFSFEKREVGAPDTWKLSTGAIRGHTRVFAISVQPESSKPPNARGSKSFLQAACRPPRVVGKCTL